MGNQSVPWLIGLYNGILQEFVLSDKKFIQKIYFRFRFPQLECKTNLNAIYFQVHRNYPLLSGKYDETG